MQDLRHKTISGVKWTGLSTGSVIVLEFVRIAVLARLLSVQDFGLMSMLMVVVGFCQAFVDMGISNAVIQKKDVSQDQMTSVFWLNMVSGLFLFIVLVISSPLVAWFYKEDKLTLLVAIMGINFLFIPLGQLSQSLLQKALRFKELAVIDVKVSFFTLIASTIMALRGLGVYALIFGVLLSSMLRSIYLLRAVYHIWAPRWHFNWEDIRPFFRFGLYQMGEKTVNYLSANVDYLLIGRFLGAEILGAYTIAYQLVVMPFLKLNPVLTKVAFPVFSLKQDNLASLRAGYTELIKMVCLVVFPIVTIIAVSAPVFIPLVYGYKWLLAVGIVQLLALIGYLKAVANPAGAILLARGRADIGFKWNVFSAALNTVVFYFAAQKSVFAVAVAWSVLALVYVPIGWYMIYYVIRLSLREYFGPIFRFFGLCAGMGLVMYFCQRFFINIAFDHRVNFLATVLSGVGTYAILIYIFEKAYMEKLWLLVAKGSRHNTKII